MINYKTEIENAIEEVFAASHNRLNTDKKAQSEYLRNNLLKRDYLLRLLVKLARLENIPLNDRKSFKILDIGPAEGIIPRALKNLGFDVWVLEHELCSQDMDKVKYYSGLKLKECIIEKGNFPFEDNFFDLVMSFGVMEHQEPPTKPFWEEMKRITKKGGEILVENPQPMNLRKRFFMMIGVNPNREIDNWYSQAPIFTGHYREHTLAELKYCAEKTGLEVLKAGGFQFIALGYLGSARSVFKKLIIKAFMMLAGLADNLKDTVYVYCRI